MELYKEVEAEIQVVVHGHCSKAPATQGRQVGHSRLVVAVAADVEVGRKQLVQRGNSKDVMIVVGGRRGEEGGHIQV